MRAGSSKRIGRRTREAAPRTQSNTDVREDRHGEFATCDWHGLLREETGNPMDHIELPKLTETAKPKND